MTRFCFAFHNIVIHPICGLLWLFGATESANRLHDATAPHEADQ